MTERLLDPELLFPSDQSQFTTNFWLRFVAWAKATDFMIGPGSLPQLLELYSDLSPSIPISKRDLYASVSKYAGRLYQGNSDVSVDVNAVTSSCFHTMIQGYSPNLGAESNVDTLKADLTAVPNSEPLVLGTDYECWNSCRQTSGALEIPCGCTERVHLLGTNNPEAESVIVDSLVSRGIAAKQSKLTIDYVKENSASLFPGIHFSHATWASTRKISNDREAVARWVLRDIGVLTDHAVWAWSEFSQPSDLISFFASNGVDMSPESPNTRGSDLMKQRDFMFGEEKVRCEWHTKFEPTRGRIHFAISNGELYIGGIVDHLATT